MHLNLETRLKTIMWGKPTRKMTTLSWRKKLSHLLRTSASARRDYSLILLYWSYFLFLLLIFRLFVGLTRSRPWQTLCQRGGVAGENKQQGRKEQKNHQCFHVFNDFLQGYRRTFSEFAELAEPLFF